MSAANQEYLRSSRAKAAEGLWPNEYPLGKGTVLYRFISSRKHPSKAADGPWWFEFEHFQTIKHFALRHGYTLGYSARLFAAILYEFSEVDGLVRAVTTSPLVAWKGKGKQIIVGKDRPLYRPEIDTRDFNRTPAGVLTESSPMMLSKMTPMQGLNEVYQLYIPGLGYPHFQFWSYFTLRSVVTIPTG